MARQPDLVPAELTDEQARLYHAITDGPRARDRAFALTDESGALRGPFGGFLLAPAVGDALQSVGAALRYRTSLGDRLRELAILAVAHHTGSEFERTAHEAVGRNAGLDEDELAAVREGREPELSDDVERAGLRLTNALLEGDVDDGLWSALVPPLEPAAVFELIALVGYYSTLALQMRVLRVDPPA